jgi:hypothetical protein
MLSKKNYYTFTPTVKTNRKSSVAFDMACIIKRLLVGSVISHPVVMKNQLFQNFSKTIALNLEHRKCPRKVHGKFCFKFCHPRARLF